MVGSNNYCIGFNWKGLLIFILPMLPNFLYFIFPNAAMMPEPINKHFAWEVVMYIFQAIFISMLILLKGKEVSSNYSSMFWIMILLLILYYIMWGFCLTGNASSVIFLGMAIFPLLYFTTAEIWLKIPIVIIPTVIFGVIHIIVSWLNFGLFKTQ